MIPTPQVQQLLTPLEDYGQLHTASVRRFGAHVIDLSYPNPRFLTDPRPYHALAALATDAEPDHLRYSPFGGFTPVRRRIAASLARKHQLPYTWRQIVLTAGASGALAVIFQSLFTSPDRVVLITPCWMDYPLYLADQGLGYDLVPTAADKHLDISAISRAMTPHTRAVVLSQPASPTGVVHSMDELTGLAEVLHAHSAGQTAPLLIADQAHRDQTWDGTCPAPAEVYPHTITVYSFGKAWQMPGQRVGYLAVSPDGDSSVETVRRLEQGMRICGQGAPTALMQRLAADLADFEPDLAALSDTQRSIRSALRTRGVDVVDAAATSFIYARCPEIDDIAFTTALANRGVLSMPSTLFHERGYFRIALNAPPVELERAVDLIAETVRDG